MVYLVFVVLNVLCRLFDEKLACIAISPAKMHNHLFNS